MSSSRDKFKRKVFAVCFSNVCYGEKYPSKVTGGVRKTVSIHTDYCPECGHALFWTDYQGYKLAEDRSKGGKC